MKYFWYVIAGILSGIPGGMGMGGGTVLIPILSIFCKVNQHLAQGANLIGFIPMATVSLVIHFKNKLVKLKKVWIAAVCSPVFGVLGSLLANVTNSSILTKVFGGFLIVLAITEFFQDKIIEKISKKTSAKNDNQS